MSKTPINWKKGRGKLGLFQPLLGSWRATDQSEMGKVVVERTLSKTLKNKYIQMRVNWHFGGDGYEEIAMIGVNAEKEITFWSFTSDGKQVQGYLADVSDIHPQAIGFEAQMPAGLGRMAYWPDEESGYRWVVENKTKKGWNRFLEHHYTAIEA